MHISFINSQNFIDDKKIKKIKKITFINIYNSTNLTMVVEGQQIQNHTQQTMETGTSNISCCLPPEVSNILDCPPISQIDDEYQYECEKLLKRILKYCSIEELNLMYIILDMIEKSMDTRLVWIVRVTLSDANTIIYNQKKKSQISRRHYYKWVQNRLVLFQGKNLIQQKRYNHSEHTKAKGIHYKILNQKKYEIFKNLIQEKIEPKNND